MGVVVAMVFAASSKADVVTFDTTLASPNTNPANTTDNLSWFNGSGNNGVQGGWTVDTNNGVELGLRAKYRQGAQIDTPTNVYDVLPGYQNPTHALWNYEFSIDLQPNGAGSGLTLNEITATLTVTDLTTGATGTVNPLTYWGDDSGFGSGLGGANGITSTGQDSPENGADWVAQNSQNPLFAQFPISFPAVCGSNCEAFNPNAADLYQFVLTVNNADTGALLASDTIDVQVTPEPAAVVLLGTLALGLAILLRRRSNAGVPTR
jgi:hypothetical protein